MPETTQSLDAIEQKIKLIITQKKDWLTVYEVIEEVKSDKLYLGENYENFTQWAKHFSDDYHIPESTVWRWLKAGHVYREVENYCTDHKKPCTPLEKLKGSPEKLCLAKTIAGTDKEKLCELVARIDSEKLSREELRNMSRRQVNGNGNSCTSNFRNQAKRKQEAVDYPNGAMAQAEQANPAIAQIVKAIQSNKNWVPFLETEKRKNLYHAFYDFPVPERMGGGERKIDILVIENLSSQTRDELVLRGVIIKTSYDELKEFELSYHVITCCCNCDYLYIAVPYSQVRNAKRLIPKPIGILSVDNKGKVSVRRDPTKTDQALLRERTLMNVVLRLIDSKQIDNS